MNATTPSAPFEDVDVLKQFLRTKMYSRDSSVAFAAAFDFFKVASMDELMALPAKTNSGSLTVMGASWWGLFPFVDMANQHAEVDDVFVGDDGYTVLFWGRWTGTCNGDWQTPNGEAIDLRGKSFENLRYAYKLTFSRETRKAILFEGLFDLAEFGRLMGSTEYATAAADRSLYPA